MAGPSEYELSAWADLQHHQSHGTTRILRAAGDAVSTGARALGSLTTKLTERVPALAQAQDALARGARSVGNAIPESVKETGASWVQVAAEKAGSTVSSIGRVGLTPASVVRRHQEAGHPVTTLRDIRRLDLRDADELVGRGMGFYYPSLAAASGAGTGLVITGGEVATGATGGAAAAPTAGMVLGTMALDASVVMSLAARAVGQVALAYGYDPEAPEEKVFSLSVINLGTALSNGAKIAAMADISRLTQALYRRASWAVLNSSVVSQLTVQFAARFGVRITKQGLAKVVPVAGIAIGATFNWATLEAVVDGAKLAYRRRFLLEKYPDLDEGAVTFDGDDVDDEVISVLDELIDLGGPDLRSAEADAAADDDDTGSLSEAMPV